jgi:FkbM family methyltransferase
MVRSRVRRSRSFEVLAWPLARVSRTISQLRRVRASVVDVAHYVQGLAARDSQRTQYLFSTATRGRRLDMILTRPGHIEDELIRAGTWEAHVAAALCFFLRDGGTLVDVGANIGYHALFVARSAPAARVLAFEPNAVVRADLVRNVALNQTTNVVVSGCALGDRVGTARFFAQRADAYNRGNSSLSRQPDTGDRVDIVDVPLQTLDAVLDPDERVAAIKIDTEGHELAVLRGASGTIARCRPAIVLELEARYLPDPDRAVRELVDLLPRYQLFELGPDRPEMAPLDVAAVRRRLFRADVVALPT